MSEITVITNLQITKIYKDVPECFEIDKTRYGEMMKERIKKAEHADDVVVTNVQEFVLDENN
jgi:hypothetical protein